ncbi:hypothetical protein D3C74_409060 [compost metagenome]
MNKEDWERIVLFLHFLIRDLLQAGTVQDREEQLHNLERRLTRQIDLIMNVVVQRIRLQQERTVQNHGIHFFG